MIVPILIVIGIIILYVTAIVHAKKNYLVPVVDIGDIFDNFVTIIISPGYLVLDVISYIFKIKIRDDKNEFYDFGN